MVKVRILSPERKTKLTDASDVTDRYHFDFKQIKSNKMGLCLRIRYSSRWRAAKAQTSLCICSHNVYTEQISNWSLFKLDISDQADDKHFTAAMHFRFECKT